MNALLTLIERLTLTTKLVAGFSSGIVIAILIGFYSLSGISAIEAEMDRMYEQDLLGISYIKNANLNLIYMSRAMRHMLIAQDERTRDASRSAIARARENLALDLAEARKRIYRPEVIARYEEFQRDLGKALEGIDHAVAMIERERAGTSAAASYITSPEFTSIVAKADGGMHELTALKEKASDASVHKARERAAGVRATAMALLGAGIVLALISGVLIGLSIKRPHQRLRDSVEELAGGKVDTAIPHVDYPNEIGIMARAIRVLQNIYRKAEDTRWIKSHGAEIGAALQRAEDSAALAQAAVSGIAKVLGAGHGALYVADGDGRFALMGSYGYRERKHLGNSFAVGEGLVGQCAMEKAPITLMAPQDYIRINSGLGEAPPAAIAVLPVILGERVLGVLELASFRPFDERELALLDALVPVLATSMEIMDRNQRTRDLLAAAREQAERMEKQAAQLEEQTVEMEAQQSELLETENWFRGIIETAPDGMLVVNDGAAIVLANPALENLFGYAGGELVGEPLSRILPGDVLASAPSTAPAGVSGRHKDGSPLAVALSVSRLPARGRHGRCLSLAVRAA